MIAVNRESAVMVVRTAMVRVAATVMNASMAMDVVGGRW